MSSHKPLILIVEDDEDLARLNGRLLKRKGYDVLLAGSAEGARALTRDNTPDLFVLDVVLPDGDGFSLCKELQAVNNAPVLFLTGKRELDDRLTGLDMGGDYYLTKPYESVEFLAIVCSLLRRADQNRKKITEVTEFTRGSLTLQIPQGKAFVNGRDIELSPKEFAVLLFLAQNEGVELSSKIIYENVWGTTMNNNSGALRKNISIIKKKLDVGNTDDFSILTRNKRGYTFIIE